MQRTRQSNFYQFQFNLLFALAFTSHIRSSNLAAAGFQSLLWSLLIPYPDATWLGRRQPSPPAAALTAARVTKLEVPISETRSSGFAETMGPDPHPFCVQTGTLRSGGGILELYGSSPLKSE